MNQIFSYTDEYKYLVEYIEKLGGSKDPFENADYATAVLNNDKVLAAKSIEGVKIDYVKSEEDDTIKFLITVEEGVKAKKPIHLCFGSLTGEFTQKLENTFILKKNSKAEFVVHCIFPDVPNMEHIMTGKVFLEDGAQMVYKETHYHGKNHGVYVDTKTFVEAKNNATYITEFKLTEGKVGEANVHIEGHLGDNSAMEIYTKIYGKEDDKIKVEDIIYLDGKKSKGLSKSRVVIIDKAQSEFIGKTYGNGERARGHIDCTEIIKDEAVAKAIPLVEVNNPTAKVTHEAAIGSLDRAQIEALMSRGLTEHEAIDVIVMGLIR